ncbi:MAG: hypothetical protein J1F23_06450 [Oscillospiraceae bacterium]|nr:hypothetical protein [Oscillospiraceae bacterium]
MLFKKKKSISAVPTLDLRQYTPEALNEIRSISAVALILLPKNPSPEFVSAYAQIKKSAVAQELNVSADATINSINGSAILNNNSAAPNSIYMVNGMLIAGMIEAERNVSVIVNGTVIVKKGSAIRPISVNGEVFETDFDENNIIMFDKKLEIDKNFIRCAKQGVFVVVDNKIIIDKDVTEDEIIEKDIRFAVGNKIICSKELFGCIQNRAHVGNKIITHEEYYEFEKKKYGKHA